MPGSGLMIGVWLPGLGLSQVGQALRAVREGAQRRGLMQKRQGCAVQGTDTWRCHSGGTSDVGQGRT